MLTLMEEVKDKKGERGNGGEESGCLLTMVTAMAKEAMAAPKQ
jgi:hypothetical protein